MSLSLAELGVRQARPTLASMIRPFGVSSSDGAYPPDPNAVAIFAQRWGEQRPGIYGLHGLFGLGGMAYDNLVNTVIPAIKKDLANVPSASGFGTNAQEAISKANDRIASALGMVRSYETKGLLTADEASEVRRQIAALKGNAGRASSEEWKKGEAARAVTERAGGFTSAVGITDPLSARDVAAKRQAEKDVKDAIDFGKWMKILGALVAVGVGLKIAKVV